MIVQNENGPFRLMQRVLRFRLQGTGGLDSGLPAAADGPVLQQ